MNQKSIGEFEEIVLLIVAILNGEAYSVNIIGELEERLKRNASLGAVQTVLKPRLFFRLKHLAQCS